MAYQFICPRGWNDLVAHRWKLAPSTILHRQFIMTRARYNIYTLPPSASSIPSDSKPDDADLSFPESSCSESHRSKSARGTLTRRCVFAPPPSTSMTLARMA